MAKSDQKNLRTQTQGEITDIKKKSSERESGLEEQLGESRAQKQALFPQVTAGYGDIMQGGGYDPAVLGNIRNAYSEYTKTGGISDTEASAMRTRAAESARGAYDVGKQEAQRSAALTGGYGDTSAATAASLARKGSVASERASIGTDAEIAKLRQAGRLEGTSGLQRTEQALTGNRLQATQGMSNVYGLSIQESDAVVRNILENYRITGSLTQNQMQILQNLANQPGVFDKIMGAIGTIGGAVSGVAGGLTSLGVGRSNPGAVTGMDIQGAPYQIPPPITLPPPRVPQYPGYYPGNYSDPQYSR